MSMQDYDEVDDNLGNDIFWMLVMLVAGAAFGAMLAYAAGWI